jgi:hypothetical protein
MRILYSRCRYRYARGPLFLRARLRRLKADQPYAMEYYYKVQWGISKSFLTCLVLSSCLNKGEYAERRIPRMGSLPPNGVAWNPRIWRLRTTCREREETFRTELVAPQSEHVSNF